MKGRKEEIIDAAARLFMQKGYEGASLKELSDSVGLSNSSGLFFHFKGKEEIYRAAVDKFVIHEQTPMQKFGGCTGLSLAEFMEVYVGQVEKTMDTLHGMADMQGKTANRYFAFVLESSDRVEECANAVLTFNDEEVELWRAVIERAKEAGEVQPHINSLQVARLFRYAFVGISYTFAVQRGVSIAQLRELLHSLYNIIKK